MKPRTPFSRSPLIFTGFIALLAAGAVSIAASDLVSWEAGNIDLQKVIQDAEWTLPTRPSLDPFRQEITEQVRLVASSTFVYHGSYHATSRGIPSKF